MNTSKRLIGGMIQRCIRIWNSGIRFNATTTRVFNVTTGFLKNIWQRKFRIGVSVAVAIALVTAIPFLVFFIALLWNLFSKLWFWFGVGETLHRSELIRNAALTVVGPLALGIACWRSVIAHKQQVTAHKQQVIANMQQQADALSRLDERFQKGSQMLGSKKFVVRMSGMTILEQLFDEHPGKFHTKVVKLLGKFTKSREGELTKLTVIDMQEALLAIGRINRLAIFAYSIRRIDVTHSNFDGVELNGGKFLRIDFFKSTFREKTKIRNFLFRDSRLFLANFDDTFFFNVVFSGSALGNASFVKAKLRNVQFVRSRLHSVSFLNTNLDRCKFIDSYADKAVFSGATLFKVSFSGTSLENANFYRAKLIRAIFSGSSLRSVSLIEANLEFADLTDADLTDADLTDANLQGVINLTQAQLDVACQSEGPSPKLDKRFAWDKDAAIRRYMMSRGEIRN